MKKLAWLGLIALVPVILTACVPYTSRSYQPTYPSDGMTGPGTTGPGMMGPGTTGRGTTGPGMMGPRTTGPGTIGPGTIGPGMMGPGMMGGTVGGWGGYDPEAKQISIDEAAAAVDRYLSAYYDDNLALVEVMEFAWNFYAEVEEEDTGIHAMELLVDKYSGQVFPEMGPNMMWNTKYGMMTGYEGGAEATADMPITAAEAEELAQQILSANLADFTVGEAETFYGYYTLHTLRNGEIEGMLSVNGYSGAVWYHNWHGSFIRMEEFHDE